MSESNFDLIGGLFEGAGTDFLGFLAKKLGAGAAKVWENVKFRQAAETYTIQT